MTSEQASALKIIMERACTPFDKKTWDKRVHCISGETFNWLWREGYITQRDGLVRWYYLPTPLADQAMEMGLLDGDESANSAASKSV